MNEAAVLLLRFSLQGVLGTVIVSSSGQPIRSTLDVSRGEGTGSFVILSPPYSNSSATHCFLSVLQDNLTKQYAEMIPSLADLARNLVRDLDPQVRTSL